MKRFIVFIVLPALLAFFLGLPSAFASPDDNVTFDFQKIDITEALQLLADYKQQNLVISPDISGQITMKLKNVPWSEAFEYVITAGNLDSFSDDKVLFVTSKENTALFSQAQEVVQYPISVYPLINILPTEVASIFHLYPDEALLASDSMSYIVAHLPPARVSELTNLITALDVQRSQIIIEARIVEVNRDYVDSLGVNWGDSSVQSGGFTASGSSITHALASSNLGLGFVSSKLILDARLSAMETEGKGNIVSSPKVFVFDRKPARIAKGFEIPYQENQADGVVTTSFKEASLSLDVLPVVSGRNIMIDLKLSKDEPDFSKVISGAPPISTSSFSSSVRLLSGQTVALGGVFSQSSSNSSRKVPFMSRIPFLGKAFKSRQSKKLDSELFLFITATLAE